MLDLNSNTRGDDERFQLLLDKYADLVEKVDTRLITDRRVTLVRHLLKNFAAELISQRQEGER